VHKVVEAGIARTFQNIRLFREMTALENVMAGRHIRTRAGLGVLLRHPLHARGDAPDHRARHELLDYVGIERFADTLSRTSPTATSAASRSRARSPPTRSCWRSTSPPPA
jgi:branched-chain amino acid transport system ATP-binding protein